VVHADLRGDMREAGLDRTAAARLEVDEQRAILRAEHIARMRLSMEQLLQRSTLVDHPPHSA